MSADIASVGVGILLGVPLGFVFAISWLARRSARRRTLVLLNPPQHDIRWIQ